MSTTTALSHEPKPRDFSVRLRRSRARSLRAARRRPPVGRCALALLAAATVPAFAAPEEWSDFTAAAADRAETGVRPMPFETPGGSFPGSAFYYLAVERTPLAQGIRADAAALPADVARAVGPAALAMRVDNSGVDRSRALQCLTAAIYYEAASEPDAGQRAVAQVVLNRVAHPAYPNTVCGVVYQGSERRTGCQFTFTCDGSLARTPNRMFWLRAESVARAALSGYVHTPVGLATHYHTIQIHPYWADSLAYLGTIGAHRFYRFGGAAGRLGTFRFAYGGGEPLAGRHAQGNASAELALAEAVVDPVAVQRAYDAGMASAGLAGLAAAPASLRAAPAPAYTQELEQRGGDALYRGDKLPGTNGIRPEYQDSGRWIAQPGA
jgi:spore germination cell wall hydrolase CwlJ-like protein